jgi:hypothetical protein
MGTRAERNDVLVDAIYDSFNNPQSRVPNPELLYRMVIGYVAGLSDDAFRDYWGHYCGDDEEAPPMFENDHLRLLDEMRQDHDGSDSWGWALSWTFTICDLIHFRSDLGVPDELEYRPGMAQSGPDPDDTYRIEILSGYTPDSWIRAVRVLTRYLNLLDRHGKSY